MNDHIVQFLSESGYKPNNETLQLKHKKYTFGFKKTYTFLIYKHKECNRNVSELEPLSKEREEIIREKNVKAERKNSMKEFLDHNNYNQRHIDAALKRANDVHTEEEIENKQPLGGGSKIITGGKKSFGFTEPLYCYLIINFTDVLDFLEVKNVNFQTYYPESTDKKDRPGPYATLIYMTEQDYINITTESNIKSFHLKVTGNDGNTVELPGMWEYTDTGKKGGFKRPPREKRYRVTRKKLKSKRHKTHKKTSITI